MALRLYTSWFSTFARKAALALELKGLTYEPIDALQRDFNDTLRTLNPRTEVPVLADGDVTVVNSHDIIQYLEWAYPSPSLYPVDIKDRVAARALERLADHRFDPIVVDSTVWTWSERDDQPPPGMKEAAQRDFEIVLGRLEAAIADRSKPWPFGSPGVVECSWYPNLLAAKPLGFVMDEKRFRNVKAWLDAMRQHPVFLADRKRTAQFLGTLSERNIERRRIFWCGDRIEWLLARGFHRWLFAEIEAGRTTFPD